MGSGGAETGERTSPGAGTAAVRGDAVAPDDTARRRSGSTTETARNPLADLRPVGPGAVLDGGFDLLRFRFGRLLGITACMYIPIWLLNLVLVVLGDAELGSAEVGGLGAQDGAAFGSAGLMFGGGSGVLWLVAALQLVALSTLGLCVGYLAMALARGDDATLGQLGRVALRRCWVALLIVPVNAVVHLAFACLGGIGWVLGDAFVFVTSIVAGAEMVGPWSAIRRGFALTRPAYGRALVISFGGLCITQVIRLSFSIGPAALVTALDPSSALVQIVAVASGAVLLITEPLTACIAARAYLDLRCRNDGLDLTLRQERRVSERTAARRLRDTPRGAVVILQYPPSDPEQLTEDVRRVMERSEFRYDKSWFDRLSEWITEQLDKLFGQGEGGSDVASGASFTGGIGSLLAWLIILVALAAVVITVIYVVRHRIARVSDDDGPATDIEVEHRRSAKEWAGDARRLEADGDWKGALRARYRHLVRTLVDRGQVPDVAGRTTGELRTDLSRTTPDASDAFDTASLLFELAWYADVPTGPDQSAEFRSAAESVLAAAAVKGVETAPDGPAMVEVIA